MANNTLITEILRGEWMLHDAHNYFDIAENLRNRLDLNFDSKYEVEERALQILDSSGNAIRSADGNITVPKNSIAQVNLMGEILPYSGWCTTGADQIVAELFRAQEMSNVDATILKIDSPGGSTKAADTFREFGKYKTKPVVGLIKDGLSLGYLAAVEMCDYLMMDGDFSSRVGSIGVVAYFRDNKAALEKEGIKVHEIYPPESDYKNKDFIDARDNNDYKGIIMNALSPQAKAFQNLVKAKRPNLTNEPGLLNGKVVFANDAVKFGLADSIGDTRMAIAKARELALQYATKKSFQ